MKSNHTNQTDLQRALSIVDELLARACSPAKVRRRVERILANCNVDSRRYTFWRLILAVLIAETTGSAQRQSQAA